jgi:hypothetical protein
MKVSSLTAVVSILLASCGCASNPTSHAAWESWDQSNLKRHDAGCPSAIYIAPKGVLVECAHKQTLIVDKIPHPVTFPVFDTLEEAAVAALVQIAAQPTSIYYEWGGVLGQNEAGKYAFSIPRTDFSGDSVEIRGHSMPPDMHRVGSYHSHPCLDEHDIEYFSPEDLGEGIFGHHIVVMGDFCTGNVHLFKPGDKPDVEQPEGDQGVWLTKGRVIGQFTGKHKLITIGGDEE